MIRNESAMDKLTDVKLLIAQIEAIADISFAATWCKDSSYHGNVYAAIKTLSEKAYWEADALETLIDQMEVKGAAE